MARPVGGLIRRGLPKRQQQGLDRDGAQHRAGVAGVVCVGMGQHKIVKRRHTQHVQVIEQRVLSLDGAGVDQAVRAVLTKQHGIALPDIQHIHDGATVRSLRSAFLGLERYAERGAQLLPAGNAAPAAQKLDDERGKHQQADGNRRGQAGKALTRHTGRSACAPPTRPWSQARRGAWHPHRGR